MTGRSFSSRFGTSIAALGAIAASFVVSIGAQAQDEPDLVKQAGVSILSFDVDKVGPLLTEMKYLWQERQAPDGSPFILVNADGERVFVISPLSCGPANKDCLGMQLVSVFDDVAKPDTVRKFNNRYLLASAGINENGNSYLSRYDIADYGIARGNVATIISIFVTLMEVYEETVIEGGQAISFVDPVISTGAAKVSVVGADDAESVIAMNAEYPKPTGLVREYTDPRLREAHERLKQIFADEALPVNRIAQ